MHGRVLVSKEMIENLPGDANLLYRQNDIQTERDRQIENLHGDPHILYRQTDRVTYRQRETDR